TRGNFDLIMNSGQMTRTTPELVHPLYISAPHQREDVQPPTYDLACNWPMIFSGIGFRTWNPLAPKPKG
ncbi:hypothetical protein AVEN_160958-1, partial [Araneus ventricosus]